MWCGMLYKAITLYTCKQAQANVCKMTEAADLKNSTLTLIYRLYVLLIIKFLF